MAAVRWMVKEMLHRDPDLPRCIQIVSDCLHKRQQVPHHPSVTIPSSPDCFPAETRDHRHQNRSQLLSIFPCALNPSWDAAAAETTPAAWDEGGNEGIDDHTGAMCPRGGNAW